MRIRLLSVMAGPDGVYQPGTVRDVPRAEAYALVEGGYAEQVDDVETAAVLPAEVAAAPSHEVAAVAPVETRGKGRRR